MIGRDSTGCVLAKIQPNILPGIPDKDAYTILIEELIALREAKTNARGHYTRNIISSKALHAICHHFQTICPEQLEEVFRLGLETKSPKVLIYMAERKKFIEYIAKILDPKLAEQYLLPLVEYSTNSPTHIFYQQVISTLISHWKINTEFDLNAVLIKVKKLISDSANSFKTKNTHLNYLRKLAAGYNIKLPIAHFVTDDISMTVEDEKAENMTDQVVIETQHVTESIPIVTATIALIEENPIVNGTDLSPTLTLWNPNIFKSPDSMAAMMSAEDTPMLNNSNMM